LNGLGRSVSGRLASSTPFLGDDRDLDNLKLLASALAGQTLDVASVEPGELSWTDGSTIFVDPSAAPTEQIRMLGVQACLVAAGSLGPEVLGQLSRRAALARRYLAIEVHRALVANDHLLPPSLRPLVDDAVARRTESPVDSLALARRSADEELPASFGTIHPRRALASAERAAAAQVSSATEVERRAPARELDQLEDDDDLDENLGQLLSSPVGGGGPVGRLLARLLTPARDRGSGGPPGADAPTRITNSPGIGGRPARSSGATGSLDGPAAGGEWGLRYPEWDVHRHRYRDEWCTVVERDSSTAASGTFVMPDGVALRRPIARLGLDLTRCRRHPQGDDIDIDAAVEAWVDTLAGSPHDDDVYVESLRRRRDLSALILLDVSGSAGEPGIAGRSVHDHQRAAAGALTMALHELGDRVGLFAFNSRGRRAVQVMRVKGFDDPLDGRVAARLGDLEPAAYTRLGAAIRHGAAILEERGGTPRRLLVVLSDGFAYDHGYEGRYGEADARRALLEARRRGVGCLCLSVGAEADPPALRRVFGAAAHATVPRAEELPGLIGPLFRSALRSAEAQRRTFQRRERTKERLAIEGRP
jgi:nitric oxide reductase NorD protein